MFTNLKRIFQFGWQGFTRNKGLSFQVIFVIIIAVLTFTSLFLFKGLAYFLISQAQKKVDISVYFKKGTNVEDIVKVKSDLYKFKGKIQSVNYISQEEARQVFLQKHKGDRLYLEALDKVGDNPFLASLNIKAKDPKFYANVSEFLNNGFLKNSIKKISYYQSEKMINRLFALIKNIKIAGIALSLVLILLIILVTFNTVKLTIFAKKEEIATMRLVGASNWFIRGPFVVQGLICAALAILISDLIIFGSLYFTASGLGKWLLGFNIFNYFQENLLFFLLGQSIFAFGLSAFSSFIAVRKYLKV